MRHAWFTNSHLRFWWECTIGGLPAQQTQWMKCMILIQREGQVMIYNHLVEPLPSLKASNEVGVHDSCTAKKTGCDSTLWLTWRTMVHLVAFDNHFIANFHVQTVTVSGLYPTRLTHSNCELISASAATLEASVQGPTERADRSQQRTFGAAIRLAWLRFEAQEHRWLRLSWVLSLTDY